MTGRKIRVLVTLLLAASLQLAGCGGGTSGGNSGVDSSSIGGGSAIGGSEAVAGGNSGMGGSNGIGGSSSGMGGSNGIGGSSSGMGGSGIGGSSATAVSIAVSGGAGGGTAGSSATATMPDGSVVSTGGGFATINLDDAGIVQSTITVVGPGGSQLTLYAGTQVLLVPAAQDPQAPALGSIVQLGLTEGKLVHISLPAGATSLVQLRIVLTVAGTETDAVFLPPSYSASAETDAGSSGSKEMDAGVPSAPFAVGAVDRGLKLIVQVALGTVDDQTLGLLYRIPASGSPVQVGTSTVTGDPQMGFNPTATGDYATGRQDPTSGAASIPTGTFWSGFTVPIPPCIAGNDGTTQICVPMVVDWVMVNELSTGEIFGYCRFTNSDIATTGPSPNGDQFWCQRIAGSSGSSAEIRVYSMQANLPVIQYHLASANAGTDPVIPGTPLVSGYASPSGGLNGPDGTVYSNPYQSASLRFAGFKELIFHTDKGRTLPWLEKHALQPLIDAGYNAQLKRFATDNLYVDVYDTLDGRVLVEQQVLEKHGWKARNVLPSAPTMCLLGEQASTGGNHGNYDYVLRIDSVDVDENNLVLSLHGIFGLSNCDNAKLTMAGSQLTLLSCADDLVTAQAPATGGGPVVLSIDDGDLDPVPLTEWNLTFDQSWSGSISSLGTDQGTNTFSVRFRADVHKTGLQPGDAAELVPFVLEKATSSVTWSDSATVFAGTPEENTTTNSGTSNNLVPLDFSTVSWPVNLPSGSYLWGQGYVNLTEKKLYLFLLADGCETQDNCTGGLGTNFQVGDCSVFYDSVYRSYLVLPLDDTFGIASSTCQDSMSGSMSGTRQSTWSVETTYPPDPNPTH